MWPFGQIWLPDAHPAAPSPVSAMLSGVMIKTGVYGLMRCFLWLVPAQACVNYPVHHWGVVVTLLGTVTLLTGTVQALRQDLSKRLLAFSTIGQAGYILLGLGVCMTLIGSADRAVSALGVAASLLVFGFVILVDNVFARLKWQAALKSAWVVAAVLGFGNILVLSLLR